MDSYICIHGHFYQPPRENPWLEFIEQQDSAYPYHDWNDRITAECYGPNSASRILSAEGRIIGIMNNYSRMSFNFGPTLLSWLEENRPEIYRTILEADRLSQGFYSGHGSALAQAFNHMIMPLANSRDKRTQVYWGIHDFEHRFGRRPEGMWLPETAVDLETLELLAECGIRFTILAPHQAAKVRSLRGKVWRDVSNSRIDPRRPYLCRLPSGRKIVLFFFDAPAAHDAAFGSLLQRGEGFADRLLAAAGGDPQDWLIHIATDGETFGHHHRFSEMALTYCLHHIEAHKLAKITVYGEYLDKFRPTQEVQIVENSSWSCIHGIERWRNNCGCASGTHPGWQQQWRDPLRRTLDWLRDTLAPAYERLAGTLLRDPWLARNQYISVVLERSPDNVEAFFAAAAKTDLTPSEKVIVLRLLEMQRNLMLMYTSCGWFFDELSGIETMQVVQFAYRSLELAEKVCNLRLEDEFRLRLREAQSNIAEHQNGEMLFQKFVKPAAVDLRRAAAHYAISSLFGEPADDSKLYCYNIRNDFRQVERSGKYQLAVGRIHVRSRLTWVEDDVSYAVLHLGDHNLSAGVDEHPDPAVFSSMHADLKVCFEGGDVAATLRLLDRHFQGRTYSLWHLFKDPQRRIINSMFKEAEGRIDNFYAQVYQDNYHFLQLLREANAPLSSILRATAQFVVNRSLCRCLETEPIDRDKLNALKLDIERWNLPVDTPMLGLLATARIDGLVSELELHPLDGGLLSRIEELLGIYAQFKIPLNLWHTQNVVYQIGSQQFMLRSKMAEKGEDHAVQWIEQFKKVTELLGVKFG
jgi:alpha-amylase/alpha-mannosidase (GH57 family)